jgi:hypothetical protein
MCNLTRLAFNSNQAVLHARLEMLLHLRAWRFSCMLDFIQVRGKGKAPV